MKRMLNALAILMAIALASIAGIISVMGLMTIFAGNAVWVGLVAGSLELAKVVVATYLHNHWKQISFAFKAYLSAAVMILMLITSLGVYGFFAKAHIDQQVTMAQNSDLLSLGTVEARIATLKETKKSLEAQEKTLQDTFGNLSGAIIMTVGEKQNLAQRKDVATARKDQSALKGQLDTVTNNKQKVIEELGELEAKKVSLTASKKKLEAEVGPIKYVAAWFSANPGAEQLEAAVQWMIMLLVITFDPLAIMLLMSATGNIARAPITIEAEKVEPVELKVTPEPVALITKVAKAKRPKRRKPNLRIVKPVKKAASRKPGIRHLARSKTRNAKNTLALRKTFAEKM